MNRSLSVQQIGHLRKNTLDSIQFIAENKHLIRGGHYNQLHNYLQHINSVLTEMVNTKEQEMADAYMNFNLNPSSMNNVHPTSERPGTAADGAGVGDNLRIVYAADGTPRTVRRNGPVSKQPEEWATVFDEKQHINPPCYVMPPQSLTSLERIRSAQYGNKVV